VLSTFAPVPLRLTPAPTPAATGTGDAGTDGLLGILNTYPTSAPTPPFSYYATIDHASEEVVPVTAAPKSVGGLLPLPSVATTAKLVQQDAAASKPKASPARSAAESGSRHVNRQGDQGASLAGLEKGSSGQAIKILVLVNVALVACYVSQGRQRRRGARADEKAEQFAQQEMAPLQPPTPLQPSHQTRYQRATSDGPRPSSLPVDTGLTNI